MSTLMSETMTLALRLRDGKRTIDELQRALNLTGSFLNGNIGVSLSDEGNRLAGESYKRLQRIFTIFMCRMIDMIYAAGLTDKRLKDEDLYDFLQAYVGVQGRGSDSSAREKLVRQMGSDVRKQHDEILKKEQGK